MLYRGTVQHVKDSSPASKKSSFVVHLYFPFPPIAVYRFKSYQNKLICICVAFQCRQLVTPTLLKIASKKCTSVYLNEVVRVSLSCKIAINRND